MKKQCFSGNPVGGICRLLLRNLSNRLDQKKIQERLDAKTTLALEKWVNEKGYCQHHGPVSEVAEALGVDPMQFTHYFRHVLGTTFRQWEKGLRISEAQGLLAKTDLSLAAIAQRVGICDRTNFNRQFTDIVGISPAIWREQHRK